MSLSGPLGSKWTAMFATDSESAVRPLVGLNVSSSSSGVQDAPESDVNQTPPFDAPTYARLPLGPTAIPVTRPDTGGFPVAALLACTDGPSEVQSVIPGGPGGSAAAGSEL